MAFYYIICSVRLLFDFCFGAILSAVNLSLALDRSHLSNVHSGGSNGKTVYCSQEGHDMTGRLRDIFYYYKANLSALSKPHTFALIFFPPKPILHYHYHPFLG